MSNENRVQLTDIPNSITLSYVSGQITFQEYETLLENRKHENEIIPFNTIVEIDTTQTEGTSSSFETALKPLTNRKRNSSSSSSTATNNKRVGSSTMDRFLNLQNIISSNEDEETDEDEENNKSTSNQNNAENLDIYDDNTTNWNDFDIETLNFDNFIKANKSTESDQANKQSKKQSNEQSNQSNQKRKRDDLDQKDLIEIKSKRRVNLIKINHF